MTSTTSDSQSSKRADVRLMPMIVPKASDVLVTELRERILSGDLPEGTALPPERELVTQTKMSRTTVREALRILEVQGLLRISAGRAGGAFVRRPNGDFVIDSVGDLIRGQSIQISTLLETREAIEPVCAQLAALRRSDDDIAALEGSNAVAADPNSSFAQFLEANANWHVTVAKATKNQLLAAFMAALSPTIYASTARETYSTPEAREVTVRAHESITAAIKQGDDAAAMRRMTRHVHTYAKEVPPDDRGIDIVVP